MAAYEEREVGQWRWDGFMWAPIKSGETVQLSGETVQLSGETIYSNPVEQESAEDD